ncbi:MAG: NYN domain-containing protein [Anaerolineales bacterium]
MPYLIDGHNLIAALPDLSLRDPDDEQALIIRLQVYCSQQRHKAIVFFDQGRFADQVFRSGAWLRVHFVRPPRTADDAMRSELARIGREAPNWTVISSDREVQAAAREAGAKVVRSGVFARQLGRAANTGEIGKPDRTLNPGEIEEWLALFRSEADERDKGEH